MRALFIALGIGITAYCFAVHEPLWVCIACVVADAILVMDYLKD